MDTKKIEEFFFDCDNRLDPVFLRLRDGDEDPISPEEKEELIKFADSLADDMISNKIKLEDMDLYISILYFLGNYTTNYKVNDVFTRLCNLVRIKLENEFRK